MSKITYTNKVALIVNPEIADINKVKDSDMNEIKSVVNTNDDNVGDLTTLTTTTKTSTVAAINELNSNKAASNDLGTIANLTTTNKTSAVAAINELDSDIGVLTNLETTSKNNVVSAINEVNSRTKPSADWIGIGSGWGCFVRRVGSVVTVTCSTSETKTLNGFSQTKLGDLPSSCKPSKGIRFPVYVRNVNYVYGNINTSGELILFNWGSTVSNSESGTIGFTVSYIVD